MKNILIILLTVLLSMSLIACGTSSINEGSDTMSEDTVLTWPKDKLPASVPELKGITITEITDGEDGLTVSFTGCDETETKMYINKIKSKGWEYKTLNTEEGKTVTCSKPNESMIFISTNDSEGGPGSITYNITE